MKKLLLSSMLVAGTMVFAFAQEGGQPRPIPVNAPMPGAKAVRAVLASSTIPQMMGDELRGFLTGDKAIDDKIKALVKERDEKIKAVHEEFQKKLKELIGERKDLRASTTDMIRERMKNASGTQPRWEDDRRPMNASGTEMRRPESPRMNEPRPAPRQENQGFFRKLLQSFLGGNVNEAQAENQ